MLNAFGKVCVFCLHYLCLQSSATSSKHQEIHKDKQSFYFNYCRSSVSLKQHFEQSFDSAAPLPPPPAAAHAPTVLHRDPKCPRLQQHPLKPEADLYSVDTMLVFYFLRLKQTAWYK